MFFRDGTPSQCHSEEVRGDIHKDQTWSAESATPDHRPKTSPSFPTETKSSGGSTAAVFGAAVRHLRHNLRSMSLRDLAKQVFVDHSNLAKWERGERLPPLDAVRVLDDVLRAEGLLVAMRTAAALPGNTAVWVTASHEGKVDMNRPIPPIHGEDMDTIRRRLLGGLVTLGTANPVSGLLDGLDGLRKIVDDNVGSSRLSEWEETAWEYAHHVSPRSGVVGDLAQDLLAAQRLTQAAPAHEALGWARVNARLTFMLAYTLGGIGQSRESRRWWASARHAAMLAEDAELLSAVNAVEAVQMLYEKRPLPMVTGRANDALAVPQGRLCRGVVGAYGAKAHALALSGDHSGAWAALADQRRAFEQLPDSVTRDNVSVYGFSEARLTHTRSLVATLAARPEAETAQREALEACPAAQIQQVAQLQLHRAVSAVRAGDVTGGLDHARAVLTALPPDDHSRYVRHVADTVLESVPAAETSRPAVREYREYLTSPQKA